MNPVVLDSSAILVAISNEPGSERLTDDLPGRAVASAVNVAEVHTNLVASGIDRRDSWEAILSCVRDGVDFAAAHAEITGNLARETRSLGVSLVDQACLASGIALEAPVYTADRAWRTLKISVPIHVIR